MRAAAAQTLRPDAAVYRFNSVVAIGVPLFAIFLQAFLPIRFHWFAKFDLPLLVTIYFSVARRSPVGGLMTGAIIGLVQDCLTQLPIGIYGLAKTIVGYAASSLSVKIDTENPGSRALLAFGFYLLHQFIYITVARGLARLDLVWQWHQVLIAAMMNAMVGVVLFMLLDKFRQRA